MNRNRDNAPPLQSEGPEDMRKDTTPSADPSKLDTIKAADAEQQTTSGRPADLQSIEAPATSGHLDSIEAEDAAPITQGKKRKSTTSSAVKNAYNNRTYDRIEIRIPKGQREQLQAAAAAAGQSTSAYIINAINAAAGHEIITPLATNPYI